MRSREIRQSFLDYFKKNGHEAVRSSPLVPQNDPTLLFTNAGMVQFKDVFTGREARGYTRATSSQKCVRAGGKHNDLENVGRTARHHTFFEMLGNFSFGDYFKEGAIAFAWEWLTREVQLDPKRMIITVFKGESGIAGDDEARGLWKRITGFGDERIVGLGMKDNFWMMGDTGPQGPCSEIHYFVGDGAPDLATFGEEPAPDGTGWMEIWNLVFMQFEKKSKDAALVPLPKPSIDTGAGLERVAAVVQGVHSNYQTDLLAPLVSRARDLMTLANVHEWDVSTRVLADHARAATFLIADGVMPSNEGRGYVLRRIMRRAIRHATRIGLGEGKYRELCELVVDEMSEAYPELVAARSLITRSVDNEDQTFRRTLGRGERLLDEEFNFAGRAASGEKGTPVPGELVFRLYDTYGFPPDLTRVIAEEHGFSIDEAGFEHAMAEQRARSEDFVSSDKGVDDQIKDVRARVGATEFLGYDATEADSEIVAVLGGGDQTLVVTRATPFYGESGGQIGDTGVITGGALRMRVTDTIKPTGDLILHSGTVESGQPAVGARVHLAVDVARRDAIRANHSATHLLHWALRKVLGEHVTQKGSLVAPDRLRFDFSHFQKMTTDELAAVEDLVNQQILANRDSQITVTGFDEARALGAMALFGEKYGDRVRVMKIGDHSVELCGGTHVRRAGDIGQFKITTEVGIAQGIRRLEAVTGLGALAWTRALQVELERASQLTNAPLDHVGEQIVRLQKEIKDRDKRIEDLQRKMAMGAGGRDVMSAVHEVGGVKVLVTRSDVGDPKALREVADQLRDKLGSGVVVLGGVADGKVALVATVTADLTARFHAGKLIGELAKMVGGKGGGRADMAQGGGTDPTKLDEALATVDRLLS